MPLTINDNFSNRFKVTKYWIKLLLSPIRWQPKLVAMFSHSLHEIKMKTKSICQSTTRARTTNSSHINITLTRHWIVGKRKVQQMHAMNYKYFDIRRGAIETHQFGIWVWHKLNFEPWHMSNILYFQLTDCSTGVCQSQITSFIRRRCLFNNFLCIWHWQSDSPLWSPVHWHNRN